MKETRVWSLALSFAVVLSATVTFALTTFATKADVMDAKAMTLEVKKDLKKEIDQRTANVQKSLDKLGATLSKIDQRLWQVLREVKKP